MLRVLLTEYLQLLTGFLNCNVQLVLVQRSQLLGSLKYLAEEEDNRPTKFIHGPCLNTTVHTVTWLDVAVLNVLPEPEE